MVVRFVRFFGWSGLCLCLGLGLLALPAEAQRLLGCIGGHSIGLHDAGAVIEIDQATGELTILERPMPIRGLSDIVALPDGRVFATTLSPHLEEASMLLEVDPETGGLVRLVTDEVRWMDGNLPFPINDLAVNPLTGVLYAVGYQGLNAVVTLDPDTGETTNVGTLTFGPIPHTNPATIAFDSEGTLWTKRQHSGAIHRVDFVDGGLDIVIQPGSPPVVGALGMAFRPGDDKIFLSDSSGENVYTMDAPEYAEELFTVAGNRRQIHGLTFLGMPQPVVEVPTLSPAALAGLACLLAVGAAVVLRRRRAPN